MSASTTIDIEKMDLENTGNVPHSAEVVRAETVRATGAAMVTVAIQVLGAMAAVGAGTARPLMVILFGELVNVFNKNQDKSDMTELKHLIDNKVLLLVVIFIGQWVLVCAYGFLFSIAAMRHTMKVRSSYLKAVVSQDLEQVSASKAATDLSTNISVLEDALSEKMGTVVQAVSAVITSFVVAFIRSWHLTLVMSVTIVFLIVKDFVTTAVDAKLERGIQACQSKASALAEESISGIRTVTACCAGTRMGNQYAGILETAKRKGMKKSLIPASQYAVTYFVILGAYALAFWYGTRLLTRGGIGSGGSIIIVLLCINQTTNALRQLLPVYSILANAMAAHSALETVINTKARINPFSEAGFHLDAIYSRIEFQDVDFSYPSRSSVQVLKGFNLTFGAGKITAVIGPSGCGKSTLVALLERWYDVNSGMIKINGIEIGRYNVKSLRSNVRVVQQDAVLFNDTIFNNVAHGLIGSHFHDLSDSEKRRLVVKVCKDVQAHDFISQFPQGYDTVVGTRGSLLSGGQRQRVAIARAIISNPVILIFDEATSSLDAESEQLVQAAIDRVSRGRTTIVIAHKLATVKRADRIVLLKDGAVNEEGTHDTLLRSSDTYVKIWMAQNLTAEDPSNHDVRKSDSSRKSLSRSGSEHTIEDPKNHAVVETVEDNQETSEDTTPEPSMTFTQTATAIIKSSRTLQIVCSASVLACLIAGGVFPGQAVIWGHDVTSFQKYGADMVQSIGFWSMMFFVLALVAFFAFFVVGSLSSIGGTITARVYREKYFRGLIRQSIYFFDKDTNTPGTLVASLSTYPCHLQGFIVVLSSLLITVVNLSSVSILGLVLSWRLTLVALFGTLPVILLAGFFRVRAQSRKSRSLADPLMDSAQYAAEVIGNIRTVSAFAMESEVCDVMARKMNASLKLFYRSILLTMPLFAFSQSGNLLGWAFSFWYSGHLLADQKINALELWIILLGVVTGSDAAGEFFASTTSIIHARSSCAKIYSLISKATSSSDTGNSAGEKPLSSSITFDHVSFTYPNVSRTSVLQDVSFHVPHGQTIAIVGPSGSGKSTIISLLERFYDTEGGKIRIGGAALDTIDVDTYRANVSLVSQETQLFEGTIRENILLGVPEGEESEEAMIQAARDAHIHEFILSLPEGYNTPCGKKGTEFSGGQRQRLAIARALVRNPTILLLDEATSALDSESEMEVKKALKNASEGRTTVAVAHRLSTIQDADRIFVLMKGAIVEQGTHAELTELKDSYWTMCQRQNLD